MVACVNMLLNTSLSFYGKIWLNFTRYFRAGREIKGGGGQAFYATAGGKDVAGLQMAIEKALSFCKFTR